MDSRARILEKIFEEKYLWSTRCKYVLHSILIQQYCILLLEIFLFFLSFFWRNRPQWASASSFMRFVDHTQQRTIVSRTPLNERSAHRRDFYLTTRNTHNRQTSMPSVGFEPTISAGEQLQTYALDWATVGNMVRSNDETTENLDEFRLLLHCKWDFCPSGMLHNRD